MAVPIIHSPYCRISSSSDLLRFTSDSHMFKAAISGRFPRVNAIRCVQMESSLFALSICSISCYEANVSNIILPCSSCASTHHFEVIECSDSVIKRFRLVQCRTQIFLKREFVDLEILLQSTSSYLHLLCVRLSKYGIDDLRVQRCLRAGGFLDSYISRRVFDAPS